MLNDLIINIIGGVIGSIIYDYVTRSEKYKIYNILLIIFVSIMSIISAYLIISFISNINIYVDIFEKISTN